MGIILFRLTPSQPEQDECGERVDGLCQVAFYYPEDELPICRVKNSAYFAGILPNFGGNALFFTKNVDNCAPFFIFCSEYEPPLGFRLFLL